MLNNGYITEKNNLNFALIEEYKMIYYFFDIICDLISNDKQQILVFFFNE